MGNLQFPTLDALIAKFEGFGKSNTVATRNNNPGNLKYGPFAQANGATGADSQGFAQFPDVATGTSAQDKLLAQYAAKGYNLQDTIAAWNGQGANSQQYTDFVAKGAGIDATNPLDQFMRDILNQDIQDMGAVKSTASNAVNTASSALLFGLPIVRIASFLIGLLCLAVGLMSLKPVNDTVVTIQNKVGKVVEKAGVAKLAMAA